MVRARERKSIFLNVAEILPALGGRFIFSTDQNVTCLLCDKKWTATAV